MSAASSYPYLISKIGDPVFAFVIGTSSAYVRIQREQRERVKQQQEAGEVVIGENLLVIVLHCSVGLFAGFSFSSPSGIARKNATFERVFPCVAIGIATIGFGYSTVAVEVNRGREGKAEPRTYKPNDLGGLVPSGDMGRFSPAPDLDKPHTVGQTVTVRHHIPPPPFLKPYPNRLRPSPDNLQELTQLEY
ncbi:hypothetical protein V8E54_008585 [Elaphomyces granulatus]